jgi:hypothetical protein
LVPSPDSIPRGKKALVREIVRQAPDTQSMLRQLHRRFYPGLSSTAPRDSVIEEIEESLRHMPAPPKGFQSAPPFHQAPKDFSGFVEELGKIMDRLIKLPGVRLEEGIPFYRVLEIPLDSDPRRGDQVIALSLQREGKDDEFYSVVRIQRPNVPDDRPIWLRLSPTKDRTTPAIYFNDEQFGSASAAVGEDFARLLFWAVLRDRQLLELMLEEIARRGKRMNR